MLNAARLKANAIIENAMEKGREIERKTEVLQRAFQSTARTIANG